MKINFFPFYILLLLVMLSLHVSAQSDENNTNKKLSVGINFSPDYSYRQLHLDDDPHNFVELRNELESPRLGFTTGIIAKYHFISRFAIESGIQFSDKGKKIDFDDFVSSDGKNYQTDPFVPEKTITKYHYYYIGIPLKLNYFLLQNKIRFIITTGVSTDFFIDGKSKTVMDYKDKTEINKTPEDKKDFNKVIFAGLAGFGIETNLSKKIEIRLEPIFRYSFTPLADSLIKEHLYSAGANFVVFYH